MSNIEVTTVDVAPGNVITIQLPGAPGPRGLQGVPGLPNVLSIGTVATLAAGAAASATISGVSPNQVLNLSIPQGVKGDKGDPNVLTVGLVTTLTEGQAATATITGTAPNQILNLGIPRGYGVRSGGLTGDVLVKLSNTDWDTGWTTPTSAPTVSTIVKRDSAGRAQVADPSVNADIATKGYVDNTAGTASNTASTLVRRSSANAFAVSAITGLATPTQTDSATPKTYVDTGDTNTLNSARRVATNQQAATAYTFALADEGKVTYYNVDNAAVAYTIPTNATVAFPVGAFLDVYAGGTGAVTITGAAGVTLRGPDGQSTVTLRAIYSKVRLTKSATDTWQVMGDIVNTSTTATSNAVSTAATGTLVKRDANGRAQVADPSVAADISTKNYVDTQDSTLRRPTVNAQTASYTLALTDERKLVQVTAATATTVTVPPNATVAFPIGTVVDVMQSGAGTVTVSGGAGVVVNSPDLSNATRAQSSVIRLQKIATDTWVLSQDVSNAVSQAVAAATNSNTASTIVKRDSNGDFAMGALTVSALLIPAADPAIPAAGNIKTYGKTDGGLYFRDNANNPRRIRAHWGSGTAFPTAGPLAGDTFFRTDVGTNGTLYQYVGNVGAGSSGWVTDSPIVCTSGTVPTGGLYAGVRRWETDTELQFTYNGTLWHLTGGRVPSCHVFRSGATYAFAFGGRTMANYDTVWWQDGGTWWASANPTRITVPVSGTYQINGTIVFPQAASRYFAIGLRINGAASAPWNVGGSQGNVRGQSAAGNSVFYSELTANHALQLNAGDYIEMFGELDGGTSSNINPIIELEGRTSSMRLSATFLRSLTA